MAKSSLLATASPDPTHVTVRCQCGAVVLRCPCPGPHPVRIVQACGVCTCTNDQPVLETEEEDQP